MKAFKPIQSPSKELNELVQAANDSFQSLFNIPMNNGVLLSSVELTSGQNNVIQHKLGRTFNGVQVLLNNANANVWFDQDDNLNQKIWLHVQCSANCTVNLWIF